MVIIPRTNKMLVNITMAVSELKTLCPRNLILMGGDWNMTPDELEDIGPRNLKIITSISQLENVLTVIGLVDVWRSFNPEIKKYILGLNLMVPANP